MTIVVQVENPRFVKTRKGRNGPFGQLTKDFKFVLILDLILTFITTVLCLSSMILVVILAVSACGAVSSEPDVELITPVVPANSNAFITTPAPAPANSTAFITTPVSANSDEAWFETAMIVLASSFCFLMSGFLGVHLMSMVFLWKGVIQRKEGFSFLWCVLSSWICAIDIGFFIFIFAPTFPSLPIFIYVLKGIHYFYRFYSIHLVGKMRMESTVCTE